MVHCGDQHGTITSYVLDTQATVYSRHVALSGAIGRSLTTRTKAYNAQQQRTDPQRKVVRCMLEQAHGMFSLGSNELHFAIRGGMSHWHLK